MRTPLSKFIPVLTFLFVGYFFISFNDSNKAAQRITLVDAIDQRKVTAQITSNGRYSGNCVNIIVTNNTNVPLHLIVGAGTTYNPEDNGEQTLIQLEDNFIALSPNGFYNGKIAAFCSEASDRCPTENTKLKLSKNTDSRFGKLFTYLKDKSIDKSTYQDVVWSISDKHSISNIVANSKSEQDLRAYVAEITGQKNTWFTSPREITVDNSGNFNYETVNIAGKIEFDCSRNKQVKQDIHKENGEIFFASQKSMTAQTGHITYSFRLSVKGWEKGKYYVRIHDGTTELAKYEFQI